jgi:hypothetical protein
VITYATEFVSLAAGVGWGRSYVIEQSERTDHDVDGKMIARCYDRGAQTLADREIRRLAMVLATTTEAQ